MTLLYWNFCVVKVCHLGKQFVRKVFPYVLKYYHKYFKISLSIAWTACLCHVILLCDFATWFCHVICHAMLSRDFCHVIYQWLVGQAGFSIDLHYVSPWCAIWRLIYLCTVKESSDMSPKIVEVSFYYFERLGYMATGRTQRLEGKFVCYPAKYLFSK